MRVNVYAEELPDEGCIEIIGKEINGQKYTGLRIPLYLPVTMPSGDPVRGPFMRSADDDDSSAITIWGKRDLRGLLIEALLKLDRHYRDGKGEAIDGKYVFTAVNACGGTPFDQHEGVVFKVHDLALPKTLITYIDECRRLGADDGQVLGCERLLERVLDWQGRNGGKVPDVTSDCELDHVVNPG